MSTFSVVHLVSFVKICHSDDVDDRRKNLLDLNNVMIREELLSVPDLNLMLCIKHPIIALSSKVTHCEFVVYWSYKRARPAPS